MQAMTPEAAAKYVLPWALLELKERGIQDPQPGPEWESVLSAAVQRCLESSRRWESFLRRDTPEYQATSEMLCGQVWSEIRRGGTQSRES